MNLRRSLQRLDRFLTLDDTQTGLGFGRFRLSLVRLRFGFFGLFVGYGFVLAGHLIGDGLSLLGGFYLRFMNLRRSLLGLDRFLTLDRPRPASGSAVLGASASGPPRLRLLRAASSASSVSSSASASSSAATSSATASASSAASTAAS